MPLFFPELAPVILAFGAGFFTALKFKGCHEIEIDVSWLHGISWRLKPKRRDARPRDDADKSDGSDEPDADRADNQPAPPAQNQGAKRALPPAKSRSRGVDRRER